MYLTAVQKSGPNACFVTPVGDQKTKCKFSNLIVSFFKTFNLNQFVAMCTAAVVPNGVAAAPLSGHPQLQLGANVNLTHHY